MKRVYHSSEDEMIYQFLLMEIGSDRYRSRIEDVLRKMDLDADIIYSGDPSNARENAMRRGVLNHFRGYEDRSGLFENFPSGVEWHWASFGAEDLPKISYINYSYWNELSDYTGSPLVAAKTVLSGRTVFDVPNDGFFEAAEYLKKGLSFPPLIMLTEAPVPNSFETGGRAASAREETRFVVLEGHKRMTAYALVPEYFRDVRVLLGYCDRSELNAWHTMLAAPTHG